MAETAWNHPPPLDGFDPLACDPALVDAVHREGAADALPTLKGLGAIVASAQAREHARLADAHPPSCRPMTATGGGVTRSSSTRRGTG